MIVVLAAERLSRVLYFLFLSFPWFFLSYQYDRTHSHQKQSGYLCENAAIIFASFFELKKVTKLTSK